MKWPFVSRRVHERELRAHRARIFVLKDSMKNAAWRCSFNRSTPDTKAAERILVMSIERDDVEERKNG